MRRILQALCLTVISSPVATAQIIRSPGGSPPIALYTSVGLTYAETIFDGTTASAWDFGSALQLRAAVEMSVANGATLGVAYSRASMPMRYSVIGIVPSETSCTNLTSGYCNASANLSTITASFTAGGSYGFHQILNLGVGMSILDDFREDNTNKALAPLDGDKDFFLAFGYGVGFGISNRLAISIVQDAGVILHQRTGLEGNRDSYHQLLITRLGFRLALGK